MEVLQLYWSVFVWVFVALIPTGFYIQAVDGQYNRVWYVRSQLLVATAVVPASLLILCWGALVGNRELATLATMLFIWELVCFFLGAFAEQFLSTWLLGYSRYYQRLYHNYFGRTFFES